MSYAIRIAALLAGVAVCSLPATPAAAQQGRSWVTCESRNDGYQRCPAPDAWRGARLVRQLSSTACIQGRTWGFERNAIWVDGGCRGRFEAGDPVASAGERVVCASDDGSYRRCPAETRRGVRLTRQLSTTACVEGRTWGTESGYIWVDRGCRAEFRVSGGGGIGPAPGNGNASQIVCESLNGRHQRCRVPGRWRGARLVRRLGNSACAEGRSWGFENREIWVSTGCRGVFEAGESSGDGGGTGGRVVVCASADGRYQRCAADVSRGVRLVRQLSDAACAEGRTWGTERGYIWVDRGCRGEFSTTGGGPITLPGRPGGTLTRMVTCGLDNAPTACRFTEGTIVSVRIARELSAGRCGQGKWDHTTDRIRILAGCRAEFEVTYRR